VYTKILVPHDGSALASAAVVHAVEIACAMHAEIVLLRLVPSADETLAEFGVDAIGGWVPETAELAREALARTVQRDLVAAHELDGIEAEIEALGGVPRVSTMLLERPAGEGILQAAAECGADIVVMSTHGRQGAGTELSAIADYVSRHATLPVLLVRPPLIRA